MNNERWLTIGNRFVLNVIVMAGFGLSGCSGGPAPDPTAPVTGKVSFKGVAVSEGSVNFYDDKRGNAAAAKLGTDGTYSIGDVVLGDYSVFITPPQVDAPVDATKPPPPPMDPANIPAKYRDTKTSGFKTSVRPGTNKADFEMVP